MVTPSAVPAEIFDNNKKQAEYLAQAYATGNDETINHALLHVGFVRHPLTKFFKEVQQVQNVQPGA
jgi:DNA-binding phage protein